MSTHSSSDRFYTEYDSRLVEEAVLLRSAGHPEENQFRRARNRIYEIADSEECEKRFHGFHADWFHRFNLGHPITAALEEQVSLVRDTRCCCVIFAPSAQDEGADLHEARDSCPADHEAKRMILLKLKPNTLLDTSNLQTFLRHEFMHIADILDPQFGYEPLLPKSEFGPAYESLVRERYRVLWDTRIDGRLLRRGWATEGIREKRLAEFAATFSIRDREAEEEFRQFFDSESQTHAGLMAFALNPGTKTDRSLGGKPQARPCPLCRFPSFSIIEGAAGLSTEARDEIAVDSPDWRPEQGLCYQCADLYRARRLSRSAEATLPRI